MTTIQRWGRFGRPYQPAVRSDAGTDGIGRLIDGSEPDSLLSSILSKVRDMAPAKPIVGKKRKYFTVEEANKALPLVKMIVERHCSPVPRRR